MIHPGVRLMVHARRPLHEPFFQVSINIPYCHDHPRHSQQHISAIYWLRRCWDYILPTNRLMVRPGRRKHRRSSSRTLQPCRGHRTNHKHGMICHELKLVRNTTDLLALTRY